MLNFNDKTAAALDDGYQGRDIVERRLANLAALAPRRGETVLDIGTGTGLLALDLARAVGAEGRVVAIEPSAEMRTIATKRCRDRENVQILDGRANNIAVDDASIDCAVSVQVFEYIEDIPAALTEVHRVLKPGGRLVIGDLHWDSHIWHSDDPDRMKWVLKIWDRHMVWRDLPAHLPHFLKEAGFQLNRIFPHICHDVEFRPDGLARLMSLLISNYLHASKALPTEDIEAWETEQHQLAAQGRFFFGLTQYILSATRI